MLFIFLDFYGLYIIMYAVAAYHYQMYLGWLKEIFIIVT